MSNTEESPTVTVCGGTAGVVNEPTVELIEGRQQQLGPQTVRRILPTLGRRLVGPWCFLDHYGPQDVLGTPGMQVGPHPHTGIQTVSWLLEGEVLHRDSLGSEQLVTPGALGVMTAGHAISHAEHSPVPHPRMLHGVQLWTALPEHARDTQPAWQHVAELPHWSEGGLDATVFMGELGGEVSPGTAFSPILGMDVALAAGASTVLPLQREFEHAAVAVSGTPVIDGVELPIGSLMYLGCQRTELRLETQRDARFMLLGGTPFEEELVMWWNFVGRSHEEIVEYRAQWQGGDRFGQVTDAAGPPMEAPPLPPGTLKSRGRSG